MESYFVITQEYFDANPGMRDLKGFSPGAYMNTNYEIVDSEGKVLDDQLLENGR